MFITQLFNTRGLRDFYATCMTSSKLCWKPPCKAQELILNHGFLPCKNSAPDPWSNRRHSPRQHGNFHDIFTGNLYQKHQKIMCSSRVFVCWVDNIPPRTREGTYTTTIFNIPPWTREGTYTTTICNIPPWTREGAYTTTICNIPPRREEAHTKTISNHTTQLLIKVIGLERTVWRILRELPYQDGNAWFTMVPLKALSNQV